MEYGLVKLLSGDEIIASIEEFDTHIVVYDPVQLVRHMTRWGPSVGVTDWLLFAKEKFSIIDRTKIVALTTGLEDNAVTQYLQYIRSERDTQHEQEDVDSLADELFSLIEAANTTVH